MQKRALEFPELLRHASFRRMGTYQCTCTVPGEEISLAGIAASNLKLKKPTIISSQLCWPQMTALVGSGFSGLLGELSKWAVHSILVPCGRSMGLARLYQSCQ